MIYLPWIAVAALLGVLLFIAHRIGDGNILEGLKQILSSEYEASLGTLLTEGEENEEITLAMNALAERIVARHGDTWTVVVEDGQRITITDGAGNAWNYTSAASLLRVYKRDE